MNENSELLREFMKSDGHSRKMWKLLLTELLYNDPTLNSDIVSQINFCIPNNINLDLILDIIDFCLDYGKKEFIKRILKCLDVTDFCHLNTKKDHQLKEETAQKYFYLMNKWTHNLGNNFPQFKEMYNKMNMNKYPLKANNMNTYLNFLTKEDISDEKFIFEFHARMKDQNNKEINKTIFWDFSTNDSKIKPNNNIIGEKEEKNDNEENSFNILNNINISGIKGEKNDLNSWLNGEEKQEEEENVQNKNKSKKYNNEEGNTDDGNNNFLRYNAGLNIDPNLGNPRAIINQNLCSKEFYNIDPNSEKNPGAKINKNLGFKEFSNIDPHLCINNKCIQNIDNNGSMCPIPNKEYNYNKENNNNLPGIPKISSMDFIQDGKNFNNINSNNLVKENKKFSPKKAKKEKNNNFNKNNSSHTQNNKNNNSKYFHNFYPDFQNGIQQKRNNNNINDEFNLFSKAKENNCTVNINIVNNNNLSHNYNAFMGNMEAPKFITFSSKCSNNDDDNSKKNEIKLKSKRANSYVKHFTNNLNNNSDLNMKNLDSYQEKIESEVNKLNRWMNDGFISFHNTYTNNLQIHVENIKKELSTCDKFINYYKNIDKNNEKANIAENLKVKISKLISRYDEFIKSNSELNKISRSSLNKSKENNDSINFI